MEFQTILKAVDKKPFVPFVLELDNGRRIHVRDPDFVVLYPSRAKLLHIVVRDPVLDENTLFHPSAVSAMLPAKEEGGSAP